MNGNLDVPTLLKVAIVVTAIQAGGWALLGVAYRISRRAAVYYLAANLVFVASLVLGAQRGVVANALTVSVASLLSMFSAMLFRIGLLHHARIVPPWREIGGHAVIVILLATTAPPTAASLPFFVAVGTVSIIITLVRICADIHAPIKAEFGAAPAMLAIAPYAAVAVLLTFGRLPPAIPELWAPSGRPVSLVTTPRFLLLTVVAVILVNFNAIGLAIARLVARVRRLAERDALTGAWNRRAIEDLLDQEAARARRSREAFSLVLFDLDRFKSINDTYGHAAGDAALRHATAIAQAGLRGADQLARFGGEEFLLLLPATDAAGALVLAERIRVAMVNAPLAWEGHEIVVTASFGVATAMPPAVDLERVIKAADAAMYRAKGRGRNLVVAHSADGTEST